MGRGKIKATENAIRGQVSALVEYILELAEKKYPITNNRVAPFLDQTRPSTRWDRAACLTSWIDGERKREREMNSYEALVPLPSLMFR